MKPFSSFLPLFCFVAFNLQAQADSLQPYPNGKAIEMFDQSLTIPPSFPGGPGLLLKYLASSIVYPDSAHEKNIQGTVAATFVINKDGSLSDAVIIKEIGGGCGEEVLRVLALMPNWLPGEVDGQPVRVRYTLPVRFSLENDKPKRKKN